MMRGARITADGIAVRTAVHEERGRRERLAGNFAIDLARRHPDWSWMKCAQVARKQAGLAPLAADSGWR